MKRLSVWIKRLIITVLFSLFLFVLLACTDTYITSRLENQLFDTLKDISAQNALLIQSKIADRFDLLTGIAKTFSGDKAINYVDAYTQTNPLSNMLNFRELGLATPNGIAYMSSNTVFNIKHRTYFQKSIQGENYVSEPLIDMRDQTDINVYSVPIYDSSNNVKAVLFAMHDAADFQDCLRVPCFEGKGYTYIINSYGDIITDSPLVSVSADAMTNISDFIFLAPQNEIAVSTMLDNMKNNVAGPIQYTLESDRHAYMTSLNINDWWLVTAVPSSVLKQRIASLTTVIHAIGVIFFIVSVIIMFYMLLRHQRNQKYLQHIAYVDSFTGLHNKPYLTEHFKSLCSKHTSKQTALVVYNIRKFKSVNEIYGTQVGNKILQKFAEIVQKNIDTTCEVAIRDHADEFAVLYYYNTVDRLQQRIQRLIESSKYIECNNNQIQLNLAVGVYTIHNTNDSFEKIYHCANIAAKKNKQITAGQVTYYSEELSEIEAQRKLSEDAIRTGIQNKEFKAWLQPKYNCITKEIIGCEALARWYKPDGSVLTPFHFVPLSEELGIISEIDELIFEDVCRNLSQWLKQGLPCVPVSVNLSRAYLGNPNYLDHLQEIIQRYDIPNKYIHLEITESAIIDNEHLLNQMIEKMHKLGFKVLLDDFGVGYSSLTSINSLNFDVLKIDKSFVDSIGTQTGDCIVQYTIALGQNLGMEIVAEGVETQAQYEFLKQHGCQIIQGYYFSKPLSREDFIQLLCSSKDL